MTPELQKKIDHAIRLLKAYDDPQNPVEIAYSGGKDSDVILQLAKEAGINFRAIYKNTTIDPPGTIKHVKDMGVEIRQPKQTFLQLVEQKGFPSRFVRFCCDKLKEYKILNKCVLGVRKEESRKRDELYDEPTKCMYYGKAKKEENYVEAIYPILFWTTEDVAEFIKDRGIKCAPVYYDEKGKFHPERRLGCMGCPLVYKTKRIKDFKEHPGLLKAWLRAGQKFMDSHPNSYATTHYGDVYEFFTRSVFYTSDEEMHKHDGLFGKADYKAFLERKFDITL